MMSNVEGLISAIKIEFDKLANNCGKEIYGFYESVQNQEHRVIFLERKLSAIAYCVGSNDAIGHRMAKDYQERILLNAGVTDINFDKSIKFDNIGYWKKQKSLGYPKCPLRSNPRFIHPRTRLEDIHPSHFE